MSGLCGLIYKHTVSAGSDADFRLRADLDRVMSRIAPRGPHGVGQWVSGRVALGHHLLREVPEAKHEMQPLKSRDGRYVILFDGRIDNREEIFFNIEPNVRPPHDCPDVEIVLAAYLTWQERCPLKLLGDFAFAVWDVREQTLFSARDPLAGRPFYYINRPAFVAFASNDEALLDLPGVSWAPCEDKLVDLFAPGVYNFDPFVSWYADVKVLHPGFSLHVDFDGSSRELRYWTFPDVRPLRFSSGDEAVEALGEVLSAAVAARLRSYGPPAMLLSGGIDSASVISAIRPLLTNRGRDPVRTYSAMSDDEANCVESRAIRALIDCGLCTPTIVRTPSFAGGLSVEALVRLAWEEAHPIDNSLLNHMPLFARAAADGVTSIMNGVAGDVTTDIPLLFPSVYLRAGRCQSAWNAAKQAATYNTYLNHLSAIEIFRRSTISLAPDSVKRAWRSARAFIWRNGEKTQSFNTMMSAYHGISTERRKTVARPPCQQMYDVALGTSRSLDWLASGQIGYDRVAGRFGLASADVWCDRRLVAFYLALPLSIKAEGSWTKALVRKYLDSRTGHQVSRRTDKSHVGWTFPERLMADTSAWQHVATKLAQSPRLNDANSNTSSNYSAVVLSPPPEGNLYTIVSSVYWRERIERQMQLRSAAVNGSLMK